MSSSTQLDFGMGCPKWTLLQVLRNKSRILSLEVTKPNIFWKDNSATTVEKSSGGRVKVIGSKELD